MSKKTKETSQRRKDLTDYANLFQSAFSELHEAVVKQVKAAPQHIRGHHDYPVMSMLKGGFPSFDDSGFFGDRAPRDYVSSVRPTGLLALFDGYQRPAISFPKGAELAEFLRTHDIGVRLNLKAHVFEGKPLDGAVDGLVNDAVERYLHLYGLDTAIDPTRLKRVLLPLILGTVQPSLNLRLVVPIAMTHFPVDHFSLSETAYITRIPRKMQLARAMVKTGGSGAVQMVVGAATHAFVSNGWHIDADNTDEVRKSLRQSGSDAVDAIETFFGALRIAAGVDTGYAQVLWVPNKWALDYFCDLTPLHGTTLRQYPSHYDDYGWTRQRPTVTMTDLKEVRRVYGALVANKSEAVRLALRRLNSCLTRTDAADAILDGTIGLELLLGDDQNQSLSYKLRLRAGALALLHADPARPADDVAAKVRRLYAARSSIVHGRRKKASKKASQPADTSHDEDRTIASDLLRFVLDVILTHPEYLDPTKIDDGLLLRGDDVPSLKAEKPRRATQKKKKL